MTAFLLAEGILYAVILILEANGPDRLVLRFITVCLACLAAAVLLGLRRKKEQVFLLLTMDFTVAADVFLVLMDRFYELAVGIFTAAQCLHGIRIQIGSGRKIWPSVIARLGLTLAGLLAAALLGQWSLLTAFGVVYAAELLMNTVDSALAVRKDRRFLLSLIGFLLFIGCDLTVGLNGIGENWGLSYEMRVLCSDLTWVFYIPSQVLIVLSASDGPKLFTKKTNPCAGNAPAGEGNYAV